VKYAGFKVLIFRMRHPSLPLYLILTTNPINTANWCYKYFFKDTKNKILILDDHELYQNRTMVVNNTYYHHSVADDNLFLPQSYIDQLNEIEIYNPGPSSSSPKRSFWCEWNGSPSAI
jgi:phage terminase large subunit